MIAAVVLAAGQSRRMGTTKINLPWGKTTVLGAVVSTLLEAGVGEIVVVVGNHPVQGLSSEILFRIRFVSNPFAQETEMLTSLQVGLRAMKPEITAALVALGDQPQMETAVVRAILEAYHRRKSPLVVPSFQMRRGHPWLVERALWEEILTFPPRQTLRDFLNRHAAEIDYLPLKRESILQDLDTPEDYERFRPREG